MFYFDKLTSRNKSTFTSKTHTILYISSDYIKGKQEQCPRKFDDSFMDLGHVNYTGKIYSDCPRFRKYCSMTKIYIDVYLHLLTKRNAKEDIAIVSTRFFVDVKSHRISAEILRGFSLNEHIDKQLICP